MTNINKHIIEDETRFLQLMAADKISFDDLADYNDQLNSREVYANGVILSKLLQLRKRHKIMYRIETHNYNEVSWGEFERVAAHGTNE